jgi:hypothetical protein
MKLSDFYRIEPFYIIIHIYISPKYTTRIKLDDMYYLLFKLISISTCMKYIKYSIKVHFILR